MNSVDADLSEHEVSDDPQYRLNRLTHKTEVLDADDGFVYGTFTHDEYNELRKHYLKVQEVRTWIAISAVIIFVAAIIEQSNLFSVIGWLLLVFQEITHPERSGDLFFRPPEGPLHDD